VGSRSHKRSSWGRVSRGAVVWSAEWSVNWIKDVPEYLVVGESLVLWGETHGWRPWSCQLFIKNRHIFLAAAHCFRLFTSERQHVETSCCDFHIFRTSQDYPFFNHVLGWTPLLHLSKWQTSGWVEGEIASTTIIIIIISRRRREINDAFLNNPQLKELPVHDAGAHLPGDRHWCRSRCRAHDTWGH